MKSKELQGANVPARYVLIDYENVQPAAMELFSKEHFKVLIFIGANQKKLPTDTAVALQPLGSRIQYIQISGAGRNALDFHIAYYIGQISIREPDACFHVISKDTGFDPLIEHARSKKVSVSRCEDIDDIQIIKAPLISNDSPRILLIVENLKQRGAAKPKSVKTLLATINALFNKQLSDQELQNLLKELQRKRFIHVNGEKVSYALPDSI